LIIVKVGICNVLNIFCSFHILLPCLNTFLVAVKESFKKAFLIVLAPLIFLENIINHEQQPVFAKQ